MSELLLSYPWFLMALVLWREARGCGHDEKVAIAHVIVNRTQDPHGRWPKSIAQVICQPSQFSSMAPPSGSTGAVAMNAVTWPKDGDPHFLECCQIADQFAAAIEPLDTTGGATNYYSDPIAETPNWADPAKRTVQIGVFHFFRL